MNVKVENQPTLDILATSKPALSSTSDMPLVETKPDSQAAKEAPADEQAPAKPAEEQSEAAAGADDEGTTETDTSESGAEGEGEKGKPAKGVKVALDRLARQREEMRERAEAAERRLAQALEANKPPAPAEPKREDFEDPFAYAEALADFRAEKRVQEKLQEAEQQRQTQEIERQAEQTRTVYNERRDAARTELADFDEVADREDVRIPIACAHAIMTHELGPKIQYHLGKNPDIAKALFDMNPVQAVAKIGEIAAELRKPAAPKSVSKTPPPIKPVGNRSGSPKDINEMSMDEYAAHRYPERYGKK